MQKLADRFLTFAVIVFACLTLTACAHFDNQLAAALQVHTEIVNATTDALEAGVIDRDQASAINRVLVCTRAMIDTADALHQAGQRGQASGQIAIALAVLAELRSLDVENWTDEHCPT